MPQGSKPLEQLADELVLEIVDHLSLTDQQFYKQQSTTPLNLDIWNLSLCNRRLSSILIPSLYHSICIDKASQLLGLLRRVIDNSIDGGLVKRLLLVRENIEKWIETAKGAVSSGFLAFAIREGHLWAKTLSFLLQFPKLNGLGIEPSLLLYDSLHNINIITTGEVFKALHSVVVVVPGPAISQTPVDISTLVPFLLVPSLRQVQAYHIRTIYSTSYENWLLAREKISLPSWRRTSNVEALALLSSGVHGDDLGRLLQLPRTLKSFTVGLVSPDSYGSISGPRPIYQALNRVSDTLEALTIRWIDALPLTTASWSFIHFGLLKRLAINWTLIAGSDPGAAPNLADLLPPVLETLGLFSVEVNNWISGQIIDHVKQLLIQKSATTLNRLCRVEICDFPMLLIPLAELASQKGVSIVPEVAAKILLGAVEHVRFDHERPLWVVFWDRYKPDREVIASASSQQASVMKGSYPPESLRLALSLEMGEFSENILPDTSASISDDGWSRPNDGTGSGYGGVEHQDEEDDLSEDDNEPVEQAVGEEECGKGSEKHDVHFVPSGEDETSSEGWDVRHIDRGSLPIAHYTD
ncbi:4382_t:CDS:2, partial [Acaulospora colombiana]